MRGVSILRAPFPSSAFLPSFLPSDLSSEFVNLIEHGVHRCNSFRMSFGWSIYHVEHTLNISPQALLRHVPVCEGHLVDDRIKFGC